MCTYSIVASLVRVAVYSWTYIPYVVSEHYIAGESREQVKAESYQEKKGLQSLTKPKKAATGRETCAWFDC